MLLLQRLNMLCNIVPPDLHKQRKHNQCHTVHFKSGTSHYKDYNAERYINSCHYLPPFLINYCRTIA